MESISSQVVTRFVKTVGIGTVDFSISHEIHTCQIVPLKRDILDRLVYFCNFATKVYGPWWITYHQANAAPLNYLVLLRNIIEWKVLNKKSARQLKLSDVMEIFFQKFRNQNYYLPFIANNLFVTYYIFSP